MHPVEHVVYFSRLLVFFVWDVHPLFFLITLVRALLGPAPGHHGFVDALGSKFHLLHHAHVDVNFGTRGVLDKVFGTYRDS